MKTVIERYYTRFYRTWGDTQEDTYVNQHTNELVVVGLAPSHPALQKRITKVEFTTNENKGSGTKKVGAPHVQRDTIIARVICEDQSVYNIRASIKGKLIESNRELIVKPELLSIHPDTSGFLIIVDPFIKGNFQENNLMGFEEFHALRNIPIQKGPVFLKDGKDSLSE